jgi:hypothetical protein
VRTVRMKYAISGGRADGTDWPPAGGLLTCSQAEAAGLVAGQLADWADEGPPAETPEDTLNAAVELRAPPPRVNAPRADWAAHAVSQGADPGSVGDMTKAALIARYGKSNG